MSAIPPLAAAVSNAGALGMVTLTWSEDAGAVIRETAALTARPFGGNFVLTEDHHRRLDQALEAGLRIVSFFWGDPSGYIEQVHDAGGIVMHTVGTAEEARRAVASGADVIVAQGWEAGRAHLSPVTREEGARTAAAGIRQAAQDRGDADMPSQAMRDVIDGFRERQKVSASQAPPTLEESRAAFAPAGRLHPVPDDVQVTEVIAGGCQPTGWPPPEPTPAGCSCSCTAEGSRWDRCAATASWPHGAGSAPART